MTTFRRIDLTQSARSTRRKGRSNGLLDASAISLGSFQGSFHFFFGDQDRIIVDPVDLFEVFESLFNFLYPSQPFQGRFSHIISVDIERDHGNVLTLGLGQAKPCHKKEKC